MDLRQLLNQTDFHRIRFKYYRAAEVDDFLQALDSLADELRKRRSEMIGKMEMLAEQNEARQHTIDNLRKELAALPEPTALTAAKSADEASVILQKAALQSDQLIAAAAQRQTRALAASRAAYYNALQFKQELARQYRELESDIDSALDVLGGLTSGSVVQVDTSAFHVTQEE